MEEIANNQIRLFISHSSSDKDIVVKLIYLIEKAYPELAGKIRCTSAEGYKLEIGDNIAEKLRSEVIESDVFIGVITAKSINSFYMTFELGARWGSQKCFLPIVCDKDESKILKEPLLGINVGIMTNESAVYDLLETLGNNLHLKMQKISVFNSLVSDFVTAIINTSEPHEISTDVKKEPPEELEPMTKFDINAAISLAEKE